MNLFGPYFTPAELGIDNDTPWEIRERLYLLVKFGLNPIRLKYGPTTITSGYRTPEHNKKVGGVLTSQHVTGEAVDILCRTADMREVFEWLRTWWPGQLLYYMKKGHVHLALPTTTLQSKGNLHALVVDR